MLRHLTIVPFLLAALSGGHVSAQARVEHIAWQTPIKDQGNRLTCIVFSAVAALEARYKRAGYTDIDLSEQFTNALGKALYLHPYWSDITTVDRFESQASWTGGGGGCGYGDNFAHWLRIPTEAVWPYQPSTPPLPAPWGPYWESQANLNLWNLDPANLPSGVLRAPDYYSATGIVHLQTGLSVGGASRNPATLEGVLRAGYEIIWDVTHVAPSANSGIWHVAQAVGGGHSMLIVGYDRTSPNPNDHYFIVKNSWGPTSHPDGYTRVGYDFVANYGMQASYLLGAATPSPWPELRMLGRRNISFDGLRGTLDIYHLPGVMNRPWSYYYNVTTTDRRLGMFTDPAGNRWKVNGAIFGNSIVFWWKGGVANLPYDEQASTPTMGRHFWYTITDDDGDEFAGRHTDNLAVGAPYFGGYLRRPTSMTANNGFLTPVFDASQPFAPDQYLGEYTLRYANRTATLNVTERNDLLLTPTERLTSAGYRCYFTGGTASDLSCVLKVSLAQPIDATLSVPTTPTQSFSFHMQSHARGLIAGRASIDGSTTGAEGVYGRRVGTRYLGEVEYFGTRCGPTGAAPWIWIDNTPASGVAVRYRAQPMLPGTAALLAVGLSNTNWGGALLPWSLAPLGAAGCSVQAEPLLTLAVIADGAGVAQLPLLTAAGPGQVLYAQWFGLVPTANPLGLVTSDGVKVTMGGFGAW